ncbi:MAG: zinc ABC transporter substrate-binding protein [Candidatus Promineofilum sp.]|nr:zinc ABC transporter substrate-binding protein [Promineifilum sp.]
MSKRLRGNWWGLAGAALAVVLLAGCGGGAAGTAAPAALTLPAVEAVARDGRPLRVVATTSLIGDAAARVGGPAITLTTLMPPGQDPHSYQPAAADLAAAADADLIFVNGWNLEEGLLGDLAATGGAPLVPVSAGIAPRPASDSGEADPHVWQDVANVMQWVDNIAATLSAADPANAATYAANAAAYRAELAELDEFVRQQTATIPAERRVLVTNHDTLAYFAAAYGFRVLGSVLPGASTLAEGTAANLAALAEAMAAAGVCSLFVETTATDQLARALSEELDDCDEVRVLSLYSDALGPPGSGADSYVGMMRANVATIVEGLSSPTGEQGIVPSPFGRGLGRGSAVPSPFGRGSAVPSPFGRGLGRGSAAGALYSALLPLAPALLRGDQTLSLALSQGARGCCPAPLHGDQTLSLALSQGARGRQTLSLALSQRARGRHTLSLALSQGARGWQTLSQGARGCAFTTLREGKAT